VLHYAVSRSVKSVFPVLGLSVFSSMLGVGIIVPLLPIYAENLGATGIWVGLIFSGFAISRTVIMPFAGRLSDRRGRKLALSVGLIAFGLTSFAYVLADSVTSLFIIRLLQGMAFCFIQPIAQAYIGDIAPEGEEGKWMGFINATFFLGWGCGPLMGGLLADHLGMDSAFYAMGVLNLLAFLGVIFFLPEISRRKEESASGSTLREMASSNVTRGVFGYQIGISSHRAIVQSFMPIFAGLTIGLSSSLIGTILSVLVLGGALLQIVSGRFGDRFNRRTIVVLGSIGVLVSMLLVPQAGGFWILLGFLAIAIIGDSIALPSASALVVDEGRKFGMGMAMAMFNMGQGIGMAIGPILAGAVSDALGIPFAFYLAAAIVFIGAVTFGHFTRREFGTRI
jgi:DHA1 family multidrug resistance protein-like MFS transporter